MFHYKALCMCSGFVVQLDVRSPAAVVARAAAASGRLWRAAPQRVVGRVDRSHASASLRTGRCAHLLQARPGEPQLGMVTTTQDLPYFYLNNLKYDGVMVLMHKKMTSTVYKQYGTTKGYCCKFVISCFQIKQEITGCLDFMTYVYSQFGFSFKLQLSTRPEQFLGEIAVWDEAEKVSRVPMPTTALSLSLVQD